ncbi:MAG: precorrin-6A synthase (deacetylating) [Solirubrobacteraceae bacterium]
MRKVLVIGIGAGDPEHLTVQAIKALNAADVLFVIDKPGERRDLVRLREQICERYVERESYRLVAVPDPERDRNASAYRTAVEAWREQRADVWEALIRDELGEEQCGAFLVWGDPALYDSTLSVLDRILVRARVEFEHEVIPGISSVSALAARHRVPLNRIGRPIEITTGRRLAEGLHAEADDVVVMLDADCSFRDVADGDTEIFWGAYIGTEDEILVAGKLRDVADQIQRLRAEARERKGWIMDTYLLRRPVRSRAAE